MAVHADSTLKLSELVEEPNLGYTVNNNGLFDTMPPPNWLDDLDPTFRDAQSPVVRLSLFDALGFLQWINTVNPIAGTHIEIGGRTYVFGHWRLMTETEWEYAARGSEGTNEYPVNQRLFAEAGGMTPELAQYHPSGKVAIVGSKPPLEWSNGFSLVHDPISRQWLVTDGAQLFDMAGNVWEWTGTRYGPYAPGASIYGTSSAPTSVVRGGSWSYDAKGARSAYRYYGSRSPDFRRDGGIGFRLVSPLSPLQDSSRPV